jgi:hypothetical protein
MQCTTEVGSLSKMRDVALLWPVKKELQVLCNTLWKQEDKERPTTLDK